MRLTSLHIRLVAIPFSNSVLLLAYTMFSSVAPRSTRVPARALRAQNVVARAEPINADVRKDEPKVVDMMSTDDMGKKV